MDENSGMVNVCLILSEVIELTQSDIWATVVSVQDTAMSTCVKGMSASKVKRQHYGCINFGGGGGGGRK